MPLRTETLRLWTPRNPFIAVPHSNRCMSGCSMTTYERILQNVHTLQMQHYSYIIPIPLFGLRPLVCCFWNYVLCGQLVRLKTGDRLIARPLPTHDNIITEEIIIYFHASGRIRTHDTEVRVMEDSNCVIPRGLCDRPNILLLQKVLSSIKLVP